MRGVVAMFMGAICWIDAGPATAEGKDEEAEVAKLPPLAVTIDKERVDLDRHRLEVKMSRKAGHVEIKVYDESGFTIAEEQHDFEGRPPNSTLVVTWSPKSSEPVAKIEVFAHDAYGYYKGIAITPWSLEIPHEEMNFETNSDVIRPSEEPKLEHSLKQIKDAIDRHENLGPISLFIAGHTDTKGEAAHNLDLSRRRARAIARWFKAHGLTLPIAYEGFGEHSLKVKTEDEVDELRNRRVDYVLSIDAPRLKSTGAPAAWKRI